MSHRRAGILLHPSSLPGPWGIGEIGPAARLFLDWLERAGQTVWQMLPLVAVDHTGSPYASPSAFARNTLLLSLDDLVADGWLLPKELPPPRSPRDVQYANCIAERRPLLHRAAERYAAAQPLTGFTERNPWVNDWALYAALTEANGTSWVKWPKKLRDRQVKALAAARTEYADAITREIALQALFAEQFARLRANAHARGIELWGDTPFFIAGDSCDTWVHRKLFRLDADGQPLAISGVPPDAFSKTGQLWGHPLYDEASHLATEYAWWVERLQHTLALFDRVRLDHFRGLAAYWEVAPDAENAMAGRWIPGPGQPLLNAVRAKLGELPFIAEDLGIITKDVEALRDDNGLPGMAVLQFAFGDITHATNPHLPYNHRKAQVVFPGTHDNDTAFGWYLASDEATRDHIRRYLLVHGHDIASDLLRCAYRSVADTAIVSMQDILGLGSDARMNVPGKHDGNWAWRMSGEMLDTGIATRLREQAFLCGRVPQNSSAGV